MALGHRCQGFKWHRATGVKGSNGTGPLGSRVQMALGHRGQGFKWRWATGVRGSDGTGPLGSRVQMALNHGPYHVQVFYFVCKKEDGNWNWEYRTGTGAKRHFTGNVVQVPVQTDTSLGIPYRNRCKLTLHWEYGTGYRCKLTLHFEYLTCTGAN